MSETLTIDPNLLAELAEADVYLRLPTDLPEVIQNLSGKVMHASRLLRLARHLLRVFEARDADLDLANTERQQAKTPSHQGGQPLHHAKRSMAMKSQAGNRERFAWAYAQAITGAVVINT